MPVFSGEVVVMVRAGVVPGIVIVSSCVAVPFGLAESVTMTLNVLVLLVAVGVPDITP